MNPNPPDRPLARVWPVGDLLQAVSDLLAARWGTVRVAGEISALTEAGSGHRYFSLKDDRGAAGLLRCALFRRHAAGSGVALREGLKVEAVGRLAVYGPRGDLQFIVESVHPVGAGSLHEEFLRLKARLQAQGFFDAERKRALPVHPRRLGLVSSLGAAALRDVLAAIARRAPQIEVHIYPCLVQGSEAPVSIVQALQAAAIRQEVDAVILARGGGSLEDLWSFNDERVVRAVAAMPMPVVSGVGHETDFTLVDFAADVRAATPTAAAELLSPMRDELLSALERSAQRLSAATLRMLDWQNQRLDQLGLLVLRPARAVAQQAHGLERRQARLDSAISQACLRAAPALDRRLSRWLAAGQQARVQRARVLDALASRLEAQNPRRVLSRGYAWVGDARGIPITSASRVSAGEAITAVWHDGRATAVVTSVKAVPPERPSEPAYNPD